ncbi:MAG: DNA polymerase ligase N-terminal domain-containing protein [bacterium]|nr:DNA polymerase ligase N-terminal domain-containing protein [bacterium]
MSALKEYQAKRKFNKTTEPKGEISESESRRFVVQEHHARNLHYDLRLETEGVLKSWAVPKGVPEEKGVKRLAVQVEDHPVDYIDFSGIIPEGEYGAGEVKIWDKGEWKPVEGDLNKGSLKFILQGEKLKGEYALVRFKDSPRFAGEASKKNWLIFKIKEH